MTEELPSLPPSFCSQARLSTRGGRDLLWRNFIIVLLEGLLIFSVPLPVAGPALAWANEEAEPVVTVEMPTIKVLGKRNRRKAPGEGAEFTGESLEISDKFSSLPQVLRQSAAVAVREPGGEGAWPSLLIRGQDPIENRFFLEGIPLTDAEFNSGNLALLPVESLAQVDIYPQGVPVFLGEDGLGGAIQLRLPRVIPDGDSAQPAPFVGARVGSYQYLKAYGQEAGTWPVPFRLYLDYTQSQEDFVYYDDNGTPFAPSAARLQRRQNNDFHRFTLLPQVALYTSARHRLKFIDLTSYSDISVPGSVSLPREGRLKQLYELAALKHEARLANGVNSESQLFWRLDNESLQDRAPAISPSALLSDSSAMALGIKTRWKFQSFFIPGLDLMTGMTWDRYQVRTTSQPLEDGIKARLQVPVGASARIPVAAESLVVNPAVLGHFYHYSLGGASSIASAPFGSAHSASYLLVSPRLGVSSCLMPQLKLRASAGSFYRAPSMVEMFGAPTGITPSHDLGYERAISGELGFNFEARDPFPFVSVARLSYTFVASRARDLIAFIQNSQQTRVAINVGESRIFSHEILAEAQTSFHLSVRGAFTLLDAINLTDSSYQYGKRLPNRPSYQGEIGLLYRWKRLELAYTLSLDGPSYWDLPNLKSLSATAEHSVSLSFDAREYGLLALEIRNLTDVITSPSSFGGIDTVDNTTGYFGYPSPGRRMYLSWKYQI